MTRRLFVADVHLQPEPETAELDHWAAFAGLLRYQAGRVDEIYILGDLCEMWIGDDDDSVLVAALTKLLTELTPTTAVFFMPGNRDFLLGAKFAARTGMTLLADPVQLADGTILTHGDALCTDDEPYQQMRALLRSGAWQADILAKSLDERRAFGAALRERSKAENSNKAGNIMDVNEQAVTRLCTEFAPPTGTHQLFVHGHTHRPGLHPVQDLPLTQRVVLGAWERCGWWAIQDTTANSPPITLHCAGVPQLAALTPAASGPE